MRNGRKSLLMLLCSIVTSALMILWPTEKAVWVEATVVESGELIQTVFLTGTVRYALEQPCISLQSGIVSRVHVNAGQSVQQGELMFQMDTEAEEKALSALQEARYEQQKGLEHLNDDVSVFAIQNELEWQTMERQLQAKIEASQIRAPAAGVVEAVYVQEGKWVAEAEMLGVTRGKGTQIVASADTGNLKGVSIESAAVIRTGEYCVPAMVRQIGAIDANGQQLVYFDIEEKDASRFQAGETVRVELITSVLSADALIPLRAVSANQTVWYIENGRAVECDIQSGESNRTHLSASAEYTGKTIILYPDRYELKNGTAVQVSE